VLDKMVCKRREYDTLIYFSSCHLIRMWMVHSCLVSHNMLLISKIHSVFSDHDPVSSEMLFLWRSWVSGFPSRL
jgi:hypothetical protein